MNSMSIHNVGSITLGQVQTSGSAQWRELTIINDDGAKFELVFFSDNIDTLTVACDELASIKNKLLTLAEGM